MCLLRKIEMDLREIHFPDTVQRIVLSFDQYMFITRDGTVPGRHMAMVWVEIVDGLIIWRLESNGYPKILSSAPDREHNAGDIPAHCPGPMPGSFRRRSYL
jgi:hypothetical protein